MRPSRILLIAGLVLLIISFFISSEKLNFQLKDTWYIVSLNFISKILGLILIVLGFIYRQTKFRLVSKKIIWTHITTTIVLSYFLILIVFWVDNYQNARPTRYTDYSSWETFGRLKYGYLVPFLWACTFILTQGLLMVNLIWGHIKENETLSP